MDVSQVTLTLVEHEGRRWLVGADGSAVPLPVSVLKPCEIDHAASVIGAVVEAERKDRTAWNQLRSDKELAERWGASLRRATSETVACLNRLGEANDAWTRRIDGSRQAVCLMVKRGSNLKERIDRERIGTWEQLFSVAFHRSTQRAGQGEWDTYSETLSRNIRGRFRDVDAREPCPPPDRGHEKTEGRQSDARRSELQVLFDWR